MKTMILPAKFILLSTFVLYAMLMLPPSTHASAYLPTHAYNDDDSIHVVVDLMPEFQGGRRGMADFINQNLKYPPEAKRLNIKGKVYVKFVVDSSGQVVDVDLVRKGNPILDAEALRIVKAMPKWKPGKHKGQFVSVTQIVTVTFPPKR